MVLQKIMADYDIFMTTCNALLIVAVLSSGNAQTVFKIGNILISQSNSPYDMERVGPAIDMGLEKVNREYLNASFRLEKISVTHGKKCDASNAPGKSTFFA